jgi:hypothetical protein
MIVPQNQNSAGMEKDSGTSVNATGHGAEFKSIVRNETQLPFDEVGNGR